MSHQYDRYFFRFHLSNTGIPLLSLYVLGRNDGAPEPNDGRGVRVGMVRTYPDLRTARELLLADATSYLEMLADNASEIEDPEGTAEPADDPAFIAGISLPADDPAEPDDGYDRPTPQQIRALRREAIAAGDREMADSCGAALKGDLDGLLAVARAIADARP